MNRKFFVCVVKFFALILLGAPLTGLARGQQQGELPFSLYIALVSRSKPVPAWVGPYGGIITALAIDPLQPDTLYAGTWGSGIFKSSDEGDSWSLLEGDSSHWFVNTIAIDPQNSQVLYAGNYKDKLYKSSDGGQTWFSISASIQEGVVVYSIAIDPANPNQIYIGTRGISNNGDPPWKGILYKSTDAGVTWLPALTNVGGEEQQDWAYSVAIHPNAPNILYAATHEHGAYRSTDYGEQWKAINDGVTNLTSRTILVSPASPATLKETVVYIGVWTHTGVFKSVTGGNEWALRANGLDEPNIYRMSIDPQRPRIIYLSTFTDGIVKSEDAAGSWFVAGLRNEEITTVAIHPQNPDILFSSTNGNGIFWSSDQGKSWTPRQAGLHATWATSLLVDPNNPDHIFASLFGDGVQHSADLGKTWEPLGSALPDLRVRALLQHPADPHILLALTESAGLYRCDLTGESACWANVPIDFPDVSLFQSAVELPPIFDAPDLLDAESAPPQSSDQAAVASPALLALAFAPANPQIAYLGTGGAGVYRSSDGGSTFQPSGLASGQVTSLAADPADANRVYAATGEGVLFSQDGGASWLNTGLLGVSCYALALDENGNPLAATSDGIYRYHGSEWSSLGLQGVAVTAIGLHPQRPGEIYAGSTAGLWISQDAGQLWLAGPPELLDMPVQAVQFDPDNPAWLYVSTATHGVLRLQP
jgi:photosystem II stability/assembly factor-like uncharacterized protein